MSSLPLLSSESIIRKLKQAGFTIAPHRGKGSHIALYKINPDGRKLLVIVPHKNLCPQRHSYFNLKAG